jgi:hypothetical protein
MQSGLCYSLCFVLIINLKQSPTVEAMYSGSSHGYIRDLSVVIDIVTVAHGTAVRVAVVVGRWIGKINTLIISGRVSIAIICRVTTI